MGTSIPSNYISTLGGDFTGGCKAWTGSYEGDHISNILFRQTYDAVKIGTDIFVVHASDHCITKIDSSGNISEFLGNAELQVVLLMEP